MRVTRLFPALALAFVMASCADADGAGDAAVAARDRPGAAGTQAPPAAEALRAVFDRGGSLTEAVEDTLRPVPLLRPAEESALRRYSNAAHLGRARSLGVRAAGPEELETLRSAGRLVRLADSTEHWVVRELESSHPYVTPHTVALLERIGERFQDRLADMGLPAFRLEVTSALRTAADQAALRGTNVNAAAGTSAHEYGTTVDLSYAAFAPPAELPASVRVEAEPWLRPYVDRIGALMLEAVAARKSRELKAILGHVLRELQSEGAVMVTLESLQPVYHITVAESLAD